jgi:secreted PhoX family phosphatase
VYFTGEEVGRPDHPHGGTLWALEVSTGQIGAAPALGRGHWENVTQVDSGRADRIALLMGDDSEGAPLYLWVGHKKPGGSFLERNGLAEGSLYAWMADAAGVSGPSKFHGTGNRQTGTFVELTVRDHPRQGAPGYDADGYADSDTLHRQADVLGGFSFARPEDLATHPRNGSRVVFASTGRDHHDGGADSWGTLYTVDLDFADLARPKATVTVLYDGNADPDRRLRSPDNLDWADDGAIYVQEDRSFAWETDPSPSEASVVRVDPTTGALRQVAEMDRSALAPLGVTDRLAGRLGAWESSGILDVSSLFGSAPGTLFLLTVQAHGIQDGVIGGDALLVQGGQLLFLDTGTLWEIPSNAAPDPTGR